MMARALLQTSLLLWLAQQTLQGGVQPQSVSWDRVLPARGVGIGVKPGVTGALGALGSRYGNKAMKAGIGRYQGAQLGVGGYRGLGLGGRAAGYGTPAGYGASLGTGMGLGTGLTNGPTLGLGHGGKQVYGPGLGSQPGYGALAGTGYPRAQQGVSTGALVGPEMASLGQAVQDLKREKSRALGPSYGRTLEPEMSNTGRTNGIGTTAPESQRETGFRPAVLPSGREVKILDPLVKASIFGSMKPHNKQNKYLAGSPTQVRGIYEPVASDRMGPTNRGILLVIGGVRQLPVGKDKTRSMGSPQGQRTTSFDPTGPQNPQVPDVLEINRNALLGSQTPNLVPKPHFGEDRKHLGREQEERPNRAPSSQAQDVRGSLFPLPQGLAKRNYLSAVADGKVVIDHSTKGATGPRVAEENERGALNSVQQGRSYGPNPGASEAQGLGIVEDFTADVREGKHLPHPHVTKSKALSNPGQTWRNAQPASYASGAGNYLGASLGAGRYGAGLGPGGAYQGGAAGKLGAAAELGQDGYPHIAAGMSTGYGDGATGYLGAVAGNGFHYGNGYSDGYRAALRPGAHGGLVQGPYGALPAGLETTGGKYGGGAQIPNVPLIPAGLEGDGSYPYAAQRLALGAEGAKATNKYGGQTGKYAVVDEGLVNGYKG